MASSADAQLFLPKIPGNLGRKPFSGFNIVERRVVKDQEIPGLPDAFIYEESVIGPRGPGGLRLVGGAIDRILFVANFSSVGDLWPWEDVVSISGMQVNKIRQILNSKA